jgi:hypothetical protein
VSVSVFRPAGAGVFLGVRSVGFSGSRSPSRGAVAALSELLPLVPSLCRVSVGCARGVDALVRAYFRSSPSLLVFSVASGRFGSGRSAFARRSVACVRSVARGDRGLLVAFPSSPVCPAGVRPSRSFNGEGSGTWGSVALALGRGRRVLLWLPSGSLPPVWSGVSWSCAGALLTCSGCWWLGVSVLPPVQLSLF